MERNITHIHFMAFSEVSSITNQYIIMIRVRVCVCVNPVISVCCLCGNTLFHSYKGSEKVRV